MFEFLLTIYTDCVNLRLVKTGNTYERGTTMSVFRVYVEKRKGFDVEVKRMKKELEEFLHIENVESIRILNRYDMEHVSEEAYKKALNTIFSEPQSDVLFEEDLEGYGDFTFAVSFLRGQYDQRADSCVQCIRTIDSTLNPVVKTAKVYIINGKLTEAEKEKRIKEAEGEAEAILKVQQANADGIRFIREAGADQAVLTIKSLEAFEKAADGKATKIIIPSELQSLAGLVKSAKEVIKED